MAEVCDQVGLAEPAHRRVGGYSLGMRQRLGLAGALLGDPPVLLLDEPANGLDPAGVAWLRGLLRDLADEGRTILVSSHHLSEVAQTVDQVVIINQGRLLDDDHGGKSASWTLAAPATPLRHAVMRLRASSWALTAPRPSSRASSMRDSAVPARW